MSKQYYVYIVTNKYNTVFYIGVTGNLQRRIYEHKRKSKDGFTSKYNLHKLIYAEMFSKPIEAIEREKQLKNWHREWKINLIKTSNPSFKELEILK